MFYRRGKRQVGSSSENPVSAYNIDIPEDGAHGKVAARDSMEARALSTSSDTHTKPPRPELSAGELADVSSYITEMRTGPCKSIEQPTSKRWRYRCTWGCSFGTASQESWKQHEAERQPQRIWQCVTCRSRGRSDQYITHLRHAMVDHAKLHHDSSFDGQHELVDQSEVPWEEYADLKCTFTLGHRLACDKRLMTWQERTDHYIQHFDWWWDRITLGNDQQKYGWGQDINFYEVPEIRLYLRPRRMIPSLYYKDSPLTKTLRVFAEMRHHDEEYEVGRRRLERFVKDEIEWTYTLNSRHNAFLSDPKAAYLSYDYYDMMRKKLEKMTASVVVCVILIQSRHPRAWDYEIVFAVIQTLRWWEACCASDAELVKGDAFRVDKKWNDAMLNDIEEVADANASWREADRILRYSGFLKEMNPLCSQEYSWLFSGVKQLGLITFGAANRSHNLLRECFMTSLKRQIACESSEIYHLCTKLDWSPLCVLSDQMVQKSLTPTLSDIITLCGDVSLGYASRCEDYVGSMWPNLGQTVVQCMQDAASSNRGTSKFSQKDVQLIIDCTTARTVVEASGPAVALLEIFECAAWLGAACRSSPQPHGIACTETVGRSGYGGLLSFDVEYTCFPTKLHEEQASNSTCWQDMFRNPVIAKGFPVPLREADEQGLEMSIPLLTALGQTYWATNFNGFLLKGFSSIMAPVKRIGNSVIWHLKARTDGDRMPYTDGHQTNSTFRCSSDAIFPGARHFVGWTHVESIAGTAAMDYAILEASETEPTGAGLCVESMLTLQGGQYINVGVNIRRANKDRPEHFSWDLYERQIDNARRWAVILSDTSLTGCHYLVDGATAILHLSLAWLVSGHVQYAPRHAMTKLQIPATSSPASAYDALVNPGNRMVELIWSGTNESWWRFENLAQEYFHVLEQIHDRVSIRNPSEIEVSLTSREIVGFDIIDLLLETGPIFPRTRKLESGAHDWLALSLKLKTVNILACNLGELIKPIIQDPSTIGCRLRNAIPTVLDYLGVTLSTLKSIISRHCRHTDFALHLTDGMYLNDPWSHFRQCACTETSLSRCTNVVSKLVSSRGSAGSVSRTPRIYEAYPDGALIFGSHGSTLTNIVNWFGHKEDNTLDTRRRKSSNSQATPIERPSSDSGVDVDSMKISSSYPSQQLDLLQIIPRREGPIKRAAKRLWKRH